jgi:hypothetical protein
MKASGMFFTIPETKELRKGEYVEDLLLIDVLFQIL